MEKSYEKANLYPKCIFMWLMVIPSMAVLPTYAYSVSINSTKKFSELSFAAKLRNPCAIVNITILELEARTIEEYELKREILLTEMRKKAEFVKDWSYTLLKTKIFHDCPSLRLPPVSAIPSPEYMAAKEPVEVLRTFYVSLVNHTAYVFFMLDQFQKYASDVTCTDINLTQDVEPLASNMRQLICLLEVSMFSLQVDLNIDSYPVLEVLKEKLPDQPLCSRRFYRDCQILCSTAAFLQSLHAYLQTARIVNPPKFPRYPPACKEL